MPAGVKVMVKQLGYKRNEAIGLFKAALQRSLSRNPEELFEEVYRSQKIAESILRKMGVLT